MKKIKTLTIDRRKWGRGKTGGRLLTGATTHNPGKMCCLGFTCLKYGLTPKQIVNGTVPVYLSKTAKAMLPDWLTCSSRGDADVGAFACINDSWDSDDADKEKMITTIFAKHDIKVKFTH